MILFFTLLRLPVHELCEWPHVSPLFVRSIAIDSFTGNLIPVVSVVRPTENHSGRCFDTFLNEKQIVNAVSCFFRLMLLHRRRFFRFFDCWFLSKASHRRCEMFFVAWSHRLSIIASNHLQCVSHVFFMCEQQSKQMRKKSLDERNIAVQRISSANKWTVNDANVRHVTLSVVNFRN